MIRGEKMIAGCAKSTAFTKTQAAFFDSFYKRSLNADTKTLSKPGHLIYSITKNFRL